ncbi:HD domain protein [Dictyocaulus viviparus]|uniref:5'-deoxynucleotidase HDDC2 n=1 Tax=Dictyocaulus viviparus TaxID=29172 RepID=A0A0D8YE99_DICVI|nr:HD domain protein [Dictyocaulus viviparus]
MFSTKVPEPETVACHMYRMAVLAMSLDGQIEGLDVTRAVTMSLVHDLAEAIVGDITPHCGVDADEKYNRENEACTFHRYFIAYCSAIQKIAAYVPVAAVGEHWIELWREYEAQETLVAKVVKHLDKFDMIAQAFDYEQKYGLNLEQFFESTKQEFNISPFVDWNRELRCRRDRWLQTKHSN